METTPDLIDRNELLGIIRLLDTPVIRRSATGSYLLDQVIHDIENIESVNSGRSCGKCGCFDTTGYDDSLWDAGLQIGYCKHWRRATQACESCSNWEKKEIESH